MTARITMATFAALFTAGTLSAGIMFGVVQDDSGEAVQGAKITVWGKDGLEATSDDQGKFRIESDELIDGNRYSVMVSAEGFDESQTMSVEIFDDVDEMEPIEIELYTVEPMPEPEPLPQVEIGPDGQTSAVAAAAAGVEGEQPLVPGEDALLIPNLDELQPQNASEAGDDIEQPASDAAATESAPSAE
jgi:hypothetical protein